MTGSWERVAALSQARAAAQVAAPRPVLACITATSTSPPPEFLDVCVGEADHLVAGPWCASVGCGGHLICGPCAHLAGLTSR